MTMGVGHEIIPGGQDCLLQIRRLSEDSREQVQTQIGMQLRHLLDEVGLENEPEVPALSQMTLAK